MMEAEYKFHIEPRDLLFLRDARPMEASDAGLGANWPRPDQIWNAFINAFHERWPDHSPAREGHRHSYKEGIDKNRDSSFRFGPLKSIGPFPVDEKKQQLYLPCPLDLSCDDEGTLHPMRLVDASGTNMPKPLSMAFSSSKMGKNSLPSWISHTEYAKYLNGESFKPEKTDLYDSERNVGVGIDPNLHSAIEGRLYQAEYLRFNKTTRMAVQVSCVLKGGTDIFEEIAKEESIPLVLGGQQGVAIVSSPKHDFSLPFSCLNSTSNTRVFLRWTLLSPAVYPEIPENEGKKVRPHPGGWLPNWIDADNGQVKLPRKDIPRSEGESRDAWRNRVKDSARFSARLVAARIEKPLAFSGWDMRTGPKPTFQAVPAGSSYVFECSDEEEAKDLSAALSWNGDAGDDVKNRRSTVLGEKGFGLGVCSIKTKF